MDATSASSPLSQDRRADPPVVLLDIEQMLALASQCGELSDDGLEAEIDALQVMVKSAWLGMPVAQRATIYEATFDAVLTQEEQAALERYGSTGNDNDIDVTIGETLVEAVEAAGGDWTPPTGDVVGQPFVQWLFKIARDHGEDEPDHEVGDLQGILATLWLGLDEAQRWALLQDEELRDRLDLVARLDELAAPGSADQIDAEEWAAALDDFGLDSSFQYSDAQAAEIFNAWLVDQALPEDFDAEQPTYRTPLNERARSTP